MNFVVATACIKMKMTLRINAATINGAYAMGISNTHGSITIGKKQFHYHQAIPSYYQLPYAFGSLIDTVFLEGKVSHKKEELLGSLLSKRVFYSKTN
jgi:imidazolonepropionase